MNKVQITIYKNEAAITDPDTDLNYYADDTQLTQIQDSNNSDELWQAYKNVQHRGEIVTNWDQINMINVIESFGDCELVDYTF